MACTSCARSFGFFNKEHGCPVCKYSFCSGCLKHKLVRDGKKLSVCLRCVKLSCTSDDVPKSSASPKGALVSQTTSKPKESDAERASEGSSENDDQLIRSKLATLKVNDSEDPGVTDPSLPCAEIGGNIDIERRLAALKGVDYKDYTNAPQHFMAPDRRTEEQKVQDLLGQFANETKLDGALDSRRTEQDEEIIKRLQALREFPVAGQTAGGTQKKIKPLPQSDSDSDSLKDEEMARKLAARYVEESKLDSNMRTGDTPDRTPSSGSLPEDPDAPLPWCTICNEDAVLRCRGCDDDLYCRSCYKEFHYDEDPQEHRTVPFVNKGRVS
ncbi:abscission/NoCut checkpoint regulator [Anopheles bellator]|uniref:abscission/NoCut checkpoint regulator n=1 Tax=Anopheles bellator TaxID=139047 RepID=UPI002647DED2|nr:abscission/NoCut checkpoint regulator [Anopheles bellator]